MNLTECRLQGQIRGEEMRIGQTLEQFPVIEKPTYSFLH